MMKFIEFILTAVLIFGFEMSGVALIERRYGLYAAFLVAGYIATVMLVFMLREGLI